jgi:DNA repair protein RadC
MDAEPALPAATLIRDLPEMDRPRERLQSAGADALSVAELLAIVLRTGTARESALALATRLLARFGGVYGLARASIPELCDVKGLGEAKAVQIKAALELGVRAQQKVDDRRPILRDPEQIAGMVMTEMSLLDQERVRVFVLDVRNRLIATKDVYEGSVHSATVRVGELLREAVRLNGSSIVLVHNHPSGDVAPSSADLSMTQQLVEAGRLMDIEVLDHIVVAGGEFTSMKRMRLPWWKP